MRGAQVKNATNALNTALSFNPVSNGVEFMLNEGQGYARQGGYPAERGYCQL